MAIINKKVGNTTYVCEVKAYRENGKVKHKWKTLGKLDADGNVIPSKKSASAEVISLESLKASLNSPDSLNSQNSQNVNAANGSNDATVLENNNYNDNNTIITASTNVTSDATANNDTTMPAMTAMPATPATDTTITTTTTMATNKPVSATTVVDMIPNNSDVMSGTSVALEPKANTRTTPVATDNISTHDTFAKTLAEASIDAVYNRPKESVISASPIVPTIPAVSKNSVVHTTVTSTSTPIITDEIVDNVDYTLNYDLDYIEDVPLIIQEVEDSEESSQRNNMLQVVSKKPTHYKMGNTKVENTVFDPDKNKGIYEANDLSTVKINVNGRNSQKKRIETLLYIDFNASKAKGLTIAYDDQITHYDREIHNAVLTLAAAGNTHITPSMIFQLLSGNTANKRNKMSEETRVKIVKSIDKMIVTRITINATAEVKANMVAEAIYENYLIPAKKVSLIVNGQLVKDCIILLDTLPLFAYARQKNQIITVDVKLLDTPLTNTPENIELKAYLIRRISSMSNTKNNMRDVIRYDTLYEYLNITAPNDNALKVKHKQIRDKIKKVLDYWVLKKFIKGYKEEKEGRSFARVIIDCYVKPQVKHIERR